jgi:hypothetical protein
MQELEDLLAHLVSDAYIRQCLSEWANQVEPSSFVLNPYALSGNLRERFLARLYEHRDELKGTCRWLFRGSARKLLAFAFHPTVRKATLGTRSRRLQLSLFLDLCQSAEPDQMLRWK